MSHFDSPTSWTKTGTTLSTKQTHTQRKFVSLLSTSELLISFLFQDLHYFILAHPDSPYQFDMATSFPKRTLPWQPDQDQYPTLAEAGLGASEALLVLDLDA